MENFQMLLRLEIEKNLGLKIRSTTEAKILLDRLIHQRIDDVSLSTIRRFWKLMPQRKIRIKSLNKLSQFIGFSSYQDFINHKNEVLQFQDNLKYETLKSKEKLTHEDFEFIEILCKRHRSVNPLVTLFQLACFQKKWEYIHELLDEKNNKLLTGRENLNIFQNTFATQISIFLENLEDRHFKNLISKLIKIDGFKKHVIYIEISLIEYNRRYGNILKRISKTNCTFEENVFLNLFTSLGEFLNGHQPEQIQYPLSDILQLPSVLVGRYFGYQILYTQHYRDEEQQNYYLNRFLEQLERKTDIFLYLHEFIHYLIFARKIDVLNDILETYYELFINDDHHQTELDIFITNVIDILYSVSQNDVSRALRIFNHLTPYIVDQHQSRKEYVVLYHLAGYHAVADKEQKELHSKKFLELNAEWGFKRLNLEYLETYLETFSSRP